MNLKNLICILVAATFSLSSMAQVSIRGSRSCGNWIQYQKERGVASAATETWLVGFLSGIAFESNKDILKGVDNPSIYLWVTNYCQANPLDGLTEAGEALADALKKKKAIKP